MYIFKLKSTSVTPYNIAQGDLLAHTDIYDVSMLQNIRVRSELH